MWWVPVRLSPDGTRMLANCDAEHYPPSPVGYTKKVMVVNLAHSSASFVTNGTACDRHAQWSHEFGVPSTGLHHWNGMTYRTLGSKAQ
jgi:hypothetical protein